MLNRRKVVQGIGAGVGALAAPALVRAQELRKIRMGFGIKSVNPIIINILISEGLGYTKEEGLQFSPAALGTNSNAQIAVDKGDTEFAVGTPAFQFPLFAKGQLPPIVNYYEYTYPYKWDVAVKPESGVQKYEDLKGKKIGVSDLGTTDYPVTRAVLQNIGVDPDKDVQWTAVGAGITAVARRESRFLPPAQRAQANTRQVRLGEESPEIVARVGEVGRGRSGAKTGVDPAE